MEEVTKYYQKKIVNDPVYGFINLPDGLIYDLIEHPFFQRMRRIKQLGLTNLVYPGANHSRLQHAIGAFHLMNQAIDTIRLKGHKITHEESQGLQIAILLHDIGHGPYSHALEKYFITGINHEEISLNIFQTMNLTFNGSLDLAISIFNNTYHKKFLHQLVSSQLDMDRLDYLKRDSFFTGVSEGVISSDRIIKMLNVVNDQLVVDEKGIYSIEKFLVARRLMYWQVYWHKTVLIAEQMLVAIFNRAKKLLSTGTELFGTPALLYFLKLNHTGNFNCLVNKTDQESLGFFCQLDDYDLMTAIKVWAQHQDLILSFLCNSLINRKLFKIEICREPFNELKSNKIIDEISHKLQISASDASDLVIGGEISNNAYNMLDDRIEILFKNNELKDISDASDMFNITVLSKEVKKYFICYPKMLFL